MQGCRRGYTEDCRTAYEPTKKVRRRGWASVGHGQVEFKQDPGIHPGTPGQAAEDRRREAERLQSGQLVPVARKEALLHIGRVACLCGF